MISCTHSTQSIAHCNFLNFTKKNPFDHINFDDHTKSSISYNKDKLPCVPNINLCVTSPISISVVGGWMIVGWL